MLEGRSGYSKGVLVTGSIKKKEAITYTPGVNDITINQGQYLNGNQVIKGDTNLKAGNIKSGVSLFGINGTYTSDANAAANQILSGKTAYVKGSKVTGTMANKSGATVEASTITSDESYTYLAIPETAYYDTNSKIKINNEKIIGSTPDEYGLPFVIESVTMSHNASSDDTRHTYAPVYVTIKWVKSCTISGVTYSGKTSQSGGGLSIGEMNGYHAKGSTTVFSGSVDSAYGADSSGVTFNYANAKIVYS